MEKRDSFFERFFGISQSGSTMKIEVLAGITTFITIAYILILNPQILADPYLVFSLLLLQQLDLEKQSSVQFRML